MIFKLFYYILLMTVRLLRFEGQGNENIEPTIRSIAKKYGDISIPIGFSLKLKKNSFYRYGYHPDSLKLPEIESYSPFVMINSDGRFHHRTFFIVRELANHGEIAYVQLDAHNDFHSPTKNHIYNGGFVSKIMRLENVKHGSLLGIIPSNMKISLEAQLNSPEGLLFSRFPVEVYLAEDTDYFARYAFVKLYSQFSPDKIPTDSVYISTDLDVIKGFRSLYPVGRMTYIQTRDLLENICCSKRVVGADFCGLTIDKKDYLKNYSVTDSVEMAAELYGVVKNGIENGQRRVFAVSPA